MMMMTIHQQVAFNGKLIIYSIGTEHTYSTSTCVFLRCEPERLAYNRILDRVTLSSTKY